MRRILVAASSAVVRAGLQSLVSAAPNLEVVGSAPGSGPLARQIETLEPDVVLVELERGSERPPLELVGVAPNGGPYSTSPALVVLADDLDGVAVAEALRMGARAVLPRDAEAEEIVAAIEAAAAGLVAFHVENADALLPLLTAARAAPTTPAEHLTPREVEVLTMMAEGSGNKAIARALGISEHTVKFHVGSIMAKLNASSRTEAVTLGLRQGLIMV